METKDVLTVRGMGRIGERIRIAREAKELSQTDIATLFDISRNAVSEWESQGGRPDLEKLPKLAIILEVRLLWLLTGDGAMREEEFGLLDEFDRKLLKRGRQVPPENHELVLTVIDKFTKT